MLDRVKEQWEKARKWQISKMVISDIKFRVTLLWREPVVRAYCL